MFIYLGLIAAIVLAGPPARTDGDDSGYSRSPAVMVESPLLRHDI